MKFPFIFLENKQLYDIVIFSPDLALVCQRNCRSAL